jgi:cysteine-rich repeat protein
LNSISKVMSFDITILPIDGENCAQAITLDGSAINYLDIESLYAWNLDILFDSYIDSTCCSTCSESSTNDSIFQFEAPSTNIRITMDKDTDSRLVMVLLDDCSTTATVQGCGSEYSESIVTLGAAGLVAGQTYTLAVKNGSSSYDWPDPNTTYIKIEPIVCGNSSIVEGIETCDDGNITDGDGCDSSCQTEPGYFCEGEPNSCEFLCGNSTDDATKNGEECDDGDVLDSDGCSSVCEVEAGFYCVGTPSLCYETYSVDASAVYTWVELVGDTSASTIALGDDEVSSALPIGFSLNFYGNNYTDIYASSNGFLTFDDSATSTMTNQCPLPSTSTPQDIIALMWDDLDPGDNSDLIYYRHFATCPVGSGECFVVQYQNFHHYDYDGYTIVAGTFEAILFANGSILIQFLDVGEETGLESTTGIENGNGVSGATYSDCNTADSLVANTAVCFAMPATSGCN